MSDDGPTITQTEFDAQIAHYLAALDDDSVELTTEDWVALVQLWNTIKWRRPSTDEAQIDAFEARFFPRAVAAATSALQLTPTKGMALYSRERDLYLGGAPRKNSMFEVVPG